MKSDELLQKLLKSIQIIIITELLKLVIKVSLIVRAMGTSRRQLLIFRLHKLRHLNGSDHTLAVHVNEEDSVHN